MIHSPRPWRVIDIRGQKFGRLTPISFKDGKWFCKCDCGGSTETTVSKLRSGHSGSCSCLSTERIAILNRVDRYQGICECGDHAFANLTRGFVGLVSPEDAHHLQTKSWNAHKTKSGAWAVTGTYTKKLHREIIGAAATGKPIDHINGNPLDNRRGNLRVCTHNGQNTMNQRKRRQTCYSKYKGVTLSGSAWVAQIGANGVHYNLGSFGNERDAALAYDKAAKRLHGEFARTNAILGLL